MGDYNRYAEAKQRLVAQLRREGITDERVLAAIGSVPRELFVPPHIRDHSYDNVALPIDRGQTISQPYIVAAMTQALQLQPDDRVLEIGTGSGYQAAILAELAAEVISIERVPELAQIAGQRLAHMAYYNVSIYLGDGTLGWAPLAPYDAIIVTAGGPDVPKTLLDQLAIHGRLVAPIGTSERQMLTLFVKGEAQIEQYELGYCYFVPLIGKEGWTEGTRWQREG